MITRSLALAHSGALFTRAPSEPVITIKQGNQIDVITMVMKQIFVYDNCFVDIEESVNPRKRCARMYLQIRNWLLFGL